MPLSQCLWQHGRWYCGQGPHEERRSCTAAAELARGAAVLAQAGLIRLGGPAAKVAIQHQDQVVGAAGYLCRVSCTPSGRHLRPQPSFPLIVLAAALIGVESATASRSSARR
ncbi:hypothetical protein [Pseudomonas sp. F(2018)]|uniref:hypothetical protein n=1 Tax=Pseudomonas sp. F(2018) TaxID=2502240 RepID=UPI0010F91A91|nr:hypothetical protein [Pseudomonas sp. F(2018)]